YQWRRNGSNIAGATAATYNLASATSANAGSYDVVITSSCGALTSQAATLAVNPATAITTQPANQSASAGQSVTFSVTASGASLTYQWRKNGSAISGATASNYTIASVTAADAGNYDVVVTGACGSVTSSVAALTINSGCATPVVSITGPASGAIYPVGTAVNFSGAFTDASGGTHTATWTFDAITQSGVVNEPARTVSGVYTFTQAGVYQVTLTVSNSCGQQGVATTIGELSALVVVYDPNAGFVTGGGWINSLAGAYVPDPTLTGKANFGFVSKYKKGNNVPEGQTEFNFNVANFKFHSTVYEWLVVAGARAQYKGSGQVNNAGDYRFILTAIDGQINGGGGQDKFRIKIWNNQGGGLVYDNQMNAPDSADPTTVLGGGQIVIHTGGNGNNLAAQAAQSTQGAGESEGEGQSRDAEVEWQIILGNEGETQSALWGGSGAPYFDVIAPGDYDGDGATDLGVFRRANGHWLIKRSADGGLTELQWGLRSDLPVAADYDGDGKMDVAVWRGATGQWFILRSSDGAKQVMVWGAGLAPYFDQPAPADYDGDGKADVAVWRASEGKWYALGSASNSVITKTGDAPRR
ncbi:MAG: immunoglobulin domain-containing protein, partial [Blastocatellia bacterium]